MAHRVLAAAALAAALLPASAEARVSAHRLGDDPADVARYWTAERKRNAIPMDRVLGGPDRMAKPGGGTTGSGAGSIEAPLPYPDAHGKVFFHDQATGYDYVCSGSAVIAGNESVVWTAGHCVNEGPGGYYENFEFVPAYRDGAAPSGRFFGAQLFAPERWVQSGNYGVDLGAVVVGRRDGASEGATLSDTVTERPVLTGSPRNQTYNLYGYPAAGKFNGQRMRLCRTAFALSDSSYGNLPATMGVKCDMTPGSSGGGWVTGDGAVASVISYSKTSYKNYLFGPHQEAEAQELLDAAAATPAP